MSVDPNEWLMGSGIRSAAMKEIGDHVVGLIMRAPDIQQQRDFTTNELKFWQDGTPRMQLRVCLMTDERDPDDPDDSGERALYVRGNMQKAIAQAVRQAGAPGLEIGAKLMVRYVGDGQAPQRGMNPPKLYEAKYKRPEGDAVPVPEPRANEIPF